MDFNNLTEEDLKTLREIPKRAGAPRDTSHQKRVKYEEFQYDLETDIYRFVIYMRQKLGDATAYSTGIRVVPDDREPLTLSRYNGSNHSHGKLKKVCHIHHMTVESQHDEDDPESGRVVKADYTDKNGALDALITEYRICGIKEWPKR